MIPAPFNIPGSLIAYISQLSLEERRFLDTALMYYEGRACERSIEQMLASFMMLASSDCNSGVQALGESCQRVKIRVDGGVAFVDECPAGIEVEITDYDVYPDASQRDSRGLPCARYVVVN